MPSIMQEQNLKSSHETTHSVCDEVTHSSMEKSLTSEENGSASCDRAAGEVASCDAEVPSCLRLIQTDDTDDTSTCGAASSRVAMRNGFGSNAVHNVAESEMCTVADYSHADEHSENAVRSSMRSVKLYCETGDQDYRLLSQNFTRSPYPLQEGSSSGNHTSVGQEEEPVLLGDGHPLPTQCLQRPDDSISIDMSAIDDGVSEHISDQHPTEAIPAVIEAQATSKSEKELIVHHDNEESRHVSPPMERGLPSRYPVLVSADCRSLSDILHFHQMRRSMSGLELIASHSDSRARWNGKESAHARRLRKMHENRAKIVAKNEAQNEGKIVKDFPTAENTPGYVGNRSVEFCVRYVTGCEAKPKSEPVDGVCDGGLKLKSKKKKKKKKTNSSALSSPEELLFSEPDRSVDVRFARRIRRLSNRDTANSGASALAEPFSSAKELAAGPDDAFQVVDRKKKNRNSASSSCRSLRLPVRGLPDHDAMLSSTLSFGSGAAVVASSCAGDSRSEGDGDSSPSSCAQPCEPGCLLEMNGGDTCTDVKNHLQPPASCSAVVAKAEPPPKVTWAAVAARSKVRDSADVTAASKSRHMIKDDDRHQNGYRQETASVEHNSPGVGLPCVSPTEELAAVAGPAETTRQPEAAIQSSSAVSWSNATIATGSLAVSSRAKPVSPPVNRANSFERVQPIGEEAPFPTEVRSLTSTAKIGTAPSVACCASVDCRDVVAAIHHQESPVRQCKGVEFVGNQWREFFSRSSSGRIAFTFHDSLNACSSGSDAANPGNVGRALESHSSQSYTGLPLDDSCSLAGGGLLASPDCCKAFVPDAVVADDAAVSAVCCRSSSLCSSTQEHSLTADAEPRLPAAAFGSSAFRSTSVGTAACPSDCSIAHLANVAYLNTGWLAVKELLATDASRVHVYEDCPVERKLPGSTPSTDKV